MPDAPKPPDQPQASVTVQMPAEEEGIPGIINGYTARIRGIRLTREEWSLAAIVGEFAINLPKQKSDLQNRISRINYAQALKWGGDESRAMKVLDAVDWSGSIRDLRLGVEVLRGNCDNAVELMLEIGKKGELVGKKGYREWPVFREFRETGQFKKAFKKIYGTEFADNPEGEPRPESSPAIAEAPTNHAPGEGETAMPSGPDKDEDEGRDGTAPVETA